MCNLFSNQDVIEGVNCRDVKKLPTLTVYESYFIFDGKCYKKIYGVAIGSPLGSTLANAFLYHHEKARLAECPWQLQTIVFQTFCRRRNYLFVSLSLPDHLSLFKTYVSRRHSNIKFTSEEEKHGPMPFLDISIERENGLFGTSVYRKPTFSGVYTNFLSFIPVSYQIDLVQGSFNVDISLFLYLLWYVSFSWRTWKIKRHFESIW